MKLLRELNEANDGSIQLGDRERKELERFIEVGQGIIKNYEESDDGWDEGFGKHRMSAVKKLAKRQDKNTLTSSEVAAFKKIRPILVSMAGIEDMFISRLL